MKNLKQYVCGGTIMFSLQWFNFIAIWRWDSPEEACWCLLVIKHSLALQVLVIFIWRETCCPHAAVPFEETVNREWSDASCEKCIQYISTARPYMNRSSSRIYEKKRQCTDSGRWRCVFIIHPVFTGTPNSMLCSLHHSGWLHWKTILQIWLLLHWVLEEQ